MIQRTALKFLSQWRIDENRKPLILRGARQVGKTTIVNEFGKSFGSYLYLNLERDDDRAIFDLGLSVRDTIDLIRARKSQRASHGDSLIFLDEIQQSPRAVAMLRYFHEDAPQVHVIAAGSLLENIVDVSTSFPVGRVDYLPVRPCSFIEFLDAMQRAPELTTLPSPVHTRAFHNEYMALFNRYCVIGGMPEAVRLYSDSGDMRAVQRVFARLVRAYIDDVEKYCRQSRLSTVVRHIISRGWNEAGNMVRMGRFAGSEYNAREVSEAMSLLNKAMLLELVYPTTAARLPVMPELGRMPKLFWFDTGLVNYVAGIQRDLIGSNDILDVWRGRVGEHIVAQELLAISDDINCTRSFWTKGRGESGAEVDLTWVIDSQLIPIEVKTGHNSHLRSLHSFIDASPIDVAVRVWSGPYSVDEVMTVSGRKPFRLINLPFYLVWNIDNIVRTVLGGDSRG